MKTVNSCYPPDQAKSHGNEIGERVGKFVKIIVILLVFSGLSLMSSCIFPGPGYGRRGGHDEGRGRGEQRGHNEHRGGGDNHKGDDHHDL